MKNGFQTQENIIESNRLYFPNIDGLRFFAFLLVFGNHFSVGGMDSLNLNFFHFHGWIGVDLFFVLSSFLLTSLLVKEFKETNNLAVGKYFLRRILRIWPLYFLYITAVLLKFGLQDVPHADARMFGLLSFTDNIWTSIFNYNTALPGVAHLWTISLEEQFYLVLPFIVPFLIKLKKMTLLYVGLGIWGLLILLRLNAVVFGVSHPFIWTSALSGDAFLVGMLAALGVFDGLFSKIKPTIKMLIGIILVALSTFLPNVDTIALSQLPLYILLALGFLFIMEGANSNNKAFSKILGNRPIKYLGKISYGMYVYHFIVLTYVSSWIHKLFGFINNDSLVWFLCLAFSLASIILISIASYEIYEKHFIKLKNKFTVIFTRPEKFEHTNISN